jgi:hypothetical protein
MEVFSTITSPAFFELVILIRAFRLGSVPFYVTLFETLRTMSEVRPFKLVFLLVDPDPFLWEAPRKLEGVLDSVTASGLLDFLDSPPTIRSAPFPERGWYMPFG